MGVPATGVEAACCAPARSGDPLETALETALVTGDDRLAVVALARFARERPGEGSSVRKRVEADALAALLAVRTGDPEHGIRYATTALSVAQKADAQLAGADGPDLEALGRLAVAAALIGVQDWSEGLAELEVARSGLSAAAPAWVPWCLHLLTLQGLVGAGRPEDAEAMLPGTDDLAAGSSADLRAALLRLAEADVRISRWAAAALAGDDRAGAQAVEAGWRACAEAEAAAGDGGGLPWFRAEVGMRRAALVGSGAGSAAEERQVLVELRDVAQQLLCEGRPQPTDGEAAGGCPGATPMLVRAGRVHVALARGWGRLGELPRAREAAERGLSLMDVAGDRSGAVQRLQTQVELLGAAADLAGAAGDPDAALEHLRRGMLVGSQARAATSQVRTAVLALRMGTERALAQAARVRARELRETITHDRLATRVVALSQDAEHDPLTGLANRRLLDSFLTAAHADARALDLPLVVAVLDVDRFKQVNDRHSHAVGDDVLRRLAEILRRQTRAEDLVARFGGEEFVLVLSGAAGDQARAILERVRAAVQAHPWPELADGLAVTVSIGACDFTDFADPAAGLRRADELLYRAKRAGRNQVCFDAGRRHPRALSSSADPAEPAPGAAPDRRSPAGVAGDPFGEHGAGAQTADAAPGGVAALVAEALRLDQAREYATSHQVASRALAEAERGEAGPLLIDALTVASLGEALVGDPELALEQATRALVGAQAPGGSHGQELWARLALLRGQLQLDDVTGALATLDQVWPDAERSRDWYPRFLCQRSFGYLAMVTDCPQDAVVWHGRALQTARPGAPPARVAMAAIEAAAPWVHLGDVLLGQGQAGAAAEAWTQGLEACDQAVELVRAADTESQRFSLAVVQGALLARLGERPRAWSRFEEALAWSAGAWSDHQLIELRVERARVLLAEGNLDAAEDECRRADLLGANEPVAQLGVLVLAADLAERRGRTAEAADLLQRRAELEGQIALGEAQARTRVLELRRRTEEALSESAAAAAHASALAAENEQLRERSEALAREALHDPLTGLPNRRQLDARLSQWYADARRSGSPLCVAMLDVDRFKAVNDTYGHDVGDEVLRRLADLVQGQIRQNELAARYGGEEVVILFRGLGLRTATQTCERIRSAVAAHPWTAIAEGLGITVSIGVADIHGEPDPRVGLGTVDALLYRAKRGGRDRVVAGT